MVESNSLFSWITRDVINNHYRKVQKQLQPPPPLLPLDEIDHEDADSFPSLISSLTEDNMYGTPIPASSPTIRTIIRLKGGRAKREIEEKKQKLAETVVAAKKQTTKTFLKTVNKSQGTQGTRGSLQAIIDDVKEGKTYQLAFICCIG